MAHSEEEVRRLQISNLHLEDKTRSLQAELIRLKAAQNQEVEAEISRLSQAYATLERETALLRERHASGEPQRFPIDNSAVTLLSQRLESEQRVVKQLQERLSLVSGASEPLGRALRGEVSVADAASFVARVPMDKMIDQLAKVSDSEIFGPALSEISRHLSPNDCRDLLQGLLPTATSKISLASLAQKCQPLPRNLAIYLASDEISWLDCASACTDVEEAISVFRLEKLRPSLTLEQEYEVIRKFGDFQALRLVPLLRGGAPEQRLCLLRCALNDAAHFLASDDAKTAGTLIRELSARIQTELASIKPSS